MSGVGLSYYARKRIVNIKTNQPNMTRADIATLLQEQDNIKVSEKSISKVWKKWSTFGTIADLPRTGAPPILTYRHMNYIDEKTEEDRELSSAELAINIHQDFGMNVSAATVRRLRYKLQWRLSNDSRAQQT